MISTKHSRDITNQITPLEPGIILAAYSSSVYTVMFPLCSTWSQENVTTDEDSLEAAILCQITHFTSFSMLVSPTGVVGEDTKEKNALEIVTYLGCAVSITCLLLTMMAFVLFR